MDVARVTPPPDPAQRFTLSFDDAHRSVLAVAAPVLRALDAPATLFVPTDYVGTSDEFLGWDELRALRDAGWTLGSHGASHVRASWALYAETPAAHLARLCDDYARSRELLERELGQAVELFAYPYGHVNAYLAERYLPEHIGEHGVKAAFADHPAYWTDAAHRYRIPRFVCGLAWQDDSGFARILEGLTAA